MSIHSDFSMWLFRASWQASVLIGLVLLAQWIFHKQLTPRWRYCLWLLVVVRLAMPFSAESGLSIFNFIKTRQVLEKSRLVAAEVPVPPAAINNRLASTTPSTDAAPRYIAGNREPSFASQPPVPSSHQGEAAWIELLKQYWFPAVAGVWLAGMLALPLYLILSTLRLARKISRQRSMTNPEILELLEDCRQLMGVRVPLVVIETKEINSPALYGFIRPRLLLPLGMVDRFTSQELRFVFLHELAHIKRHDIAMNWVMTALQSLHWFNPLVWLAFHRMRADRELACDALALSYTKDDEARPYGHTIIKLLEGFARPAAAPSLLGILEDQDQMKQRIGMIAQFRRTNRWPLVAVGLLAVLIMVCLTDAKTAKSTIDAASVRSQRTMAASFTSVPGERPKPSARLAADGISMLILDADTGAGIPHAVLNADYHLIKERRWLHVSNMVADANGAVRVKFPTNSYEAFFIYANAEHHVPKLVNWGWDGSLPPRSYTMRLSKGVKIGGQVQTEEGEPIAGAKVIVRGPSFEQSSIGNESYGFQNEVNWVTTDTSGQWTFDQVPADFGDFTMILEHPNYAKSTFSTDRNSRADGYLPKVAMNALWSEDAVLVLQRGQTVTGLVVDAEGRPIPRPQVRRGALELTGDETGHFYFYHVVPGRMGLNITADGYAETAAKFRITNNMPAIQVQLQEAALLSGQVVDSKGAPISGATILLGKNRYQAMDNIHTSDEQGKFSFTHIPKNGGDVVLTVEAEGFAPDLKVVPLMSGGSEVRFQLARGRA
ncbi:MAG TPA: M56 family metallopeptidase, partial [Verrucomicrobiae bacterium]|nr:M56 family metallopeptidase [Verrucomicrobiae bacterium]